MTSPMTVNFSSVWWKFCVRVCMCARARACCRNARQCLIIIKSMSVILFAYWWILYRVHGTHLCNSSSFFIEFFLYIIFEWIIKVCFYKQFSPSKLTIKFTFFEVRRCIKQFYRVNFSSFDYFSIVVERDDSVRKISRNGRR